MIKTALILLGTTLCHQTAFSSTAEQAMRYSAANAITFKTSQLTKDFVGSAFLLRHQNQTYAVTAKHVLLETMDQGVDSISISDHVSEWQLQPFNENTGVVKLGQLLNEDSDQTLDISVLGDDWLLFAVASNQSSLMPLKLAEQPLKTGDAITVYGCSYSNQDHCKQNKLTGHYVKTDGVNLLIKLESADMSQLRGLSGAPVLNEHQEVVAIVSNVVPDETQGGFYFAPFVIDPVREYLSKKTSKSIKEIN